jgi:twitching motility protein PilT
LSNVLQGILAQDLLPSADRSRRVLAYEMMIATPAIRNGIRENKITQLENTMQVSAKDGMVLMDNYLAELYERCLITYDTAVSRARRADSIVKDNQPANGQPARR